MGRKEQKTLKKVIDMGYAVKNSTQAHIINNFTDLFNDKFYMKENVKTDRIPVFNLPNVHLQANFLLVLKNNPQIVDLVPTEQRESFDNFVHYMRTNKMCFNCSNCRKKCYNNQDYNMRPDKAICDLRQLYRLIQKPHVVIGEIIQNTINSKYVRLNGSGEIHNEFILDIYKRVARANPETVYFTYTKNYDLLAGRKLPKNLVINYSDFGTTEKIELIKDLILKNTNIYKSVTSEEITEIKKDEKLSKHICYGNCSSCKMCTKKSGITIFCEVHVLNKNK